MNGSFSLVLCNNYSIHMKTIEASESMYLDFMAPTQSEITWSLDSHEPKYYKTDVENVKRKLKNIWPGHFSLIHNFIRFRIVIT